MNMLVHFVKTPLHQINGFSDILMQSFADTDNSISDDDRVESARYIKNATANLSTSVNKLLTYHRLDEVESQNQIETVNINQCAQDFVDLLPADCETGIEGCAGTIETNPVAMKTALESLASYYKAKAPEAVLVIELSNLPDGTAQLSISDNAEPVSAEEFAEKTKPLTKIENYLTGAGSEMPMALRTVARAIEITGGWFGHTSDAEGNTFTIRVPVRGAAVAASKKTA